MFARPSEKFIKPVELLTNVNIRNSLSVIFKRFKYDHIRIEFMNGYNSENFRFYLIDKSYYFDAKKLKDVILRHPYFSKNLAEAEQFFIDLIDLSSTMKNWNRVMLLMVRFHLIVSNAKQIFDRFFTPYDESCLFYGEDFVFNSLEQLVFTFPFSEMMFQHLGLKEFIRRLSDFLDIADKISLFRLSQEMMSRFYLQQNQQ